MAKKQESQVIEVLLDALSNEKELLNKVRNYVIWRSQDALLARPTTIYRDGYRDGEAQVLHDLTVILFGVERFGK